MCDLWLPPWSLMQSHTTNNNNTSNINTVEIDQNDINNKNKSRLATATTLGFIFTNCHIDNNNNNNNLEIPSFCPDLSNQSNISIQSNISTISTISNEYNQHQITIQDIPPVLISHILSFLSSFTIIKLSTLSIHFHAAIQDQSACFQSLNIMFFIKIFNSNYCPNNIVYFKRFKAVKRIQMSSDQLIQINDINNSNDDDDTDIIHLFWSNFNRLESIELICKNNDNVHNGLIMNTLQIISQQQIKNINYSIIQLILYNICINNDLFEILSNMKSLNTLKIIGIITFENNTFDDNQWIFNNFGKLRMSINHIHNVSFFFETMHFIPYLFLLLFYHENIKSFSIQFAKSHIMTLNNMTLNNKDITSILQKCVNPQQLKELCITPHLFCDLEDDDMMNSISLMIERIFYYHSFPSLEVLKFGDWNNETWISLVSDQDYIKWYQFIINHYQTLNTLIFNNNIGNIHGNNQCNSSLLNASIWEPFNFLYRIFSKQYLFDIDNISKNKLIFWYENILKEFKFEIGETHQTLQEIMDQFNDLNQYQNNDENIYLHQFNIAKCEWLNDTKLKIRSLIQYFKQYNISYCIQLSFIGDHQILFLKQLFADYFNHHSLIQENEENICFT